MSCTHPVVVVRRFFSVPERVSTLRTWKKRLPYKLDRDLLIVQKVCALEDDPEGPLSDLLANAVVHANNVG